MSHHHWHTGLPGRSNIPPRSTSPANALRDESVRDDRRLDDLRALADGPRLRDVHELDSIPLRLALLDPVEHYVAERSCRDRFATWGAGERCAFRVRVVVEPTAPGLQGQAEGVVSYARGELLEGQRAEPPGCEDLMRCIAATKLGTSTPAPDGAVPVSLDLSIPSNADETCDPEALRAQIGVIEADLAAAADSVPDDATDVTFRHLYQERILEFLRLRSRDCG